MRRVVRQASAEGVPTTVCGEMGGLPLEAMALIGIGVERLSITPAAVDSIKAMIGSLDAERLHGQMNDWLSDPPPDMRQELLDWSANQNIAIG